MKLPIFSTLILSSFSILDAAPQHSGQASAEITIQHSSLPAGGESWIALKLTPEAGWHTYWKNPGEMGMATSISWTLPKGIKISDLQFPAPHTFTSNDINSLGYDQEVTILAKLTAAPDITPAKLSITGEASWLTCTPEACEPGNIKTSIPLEITAKDTPAVTTPADAEIKKSLNELPIVSSDWQATCLKQGDTIIVRVQPPAPSLITSGKFNAYFATPEIVSIPSEQTWKKDGDAWVATFPISEYFKTIPQTIELTLSGEALSKSVTILIKK